MVTIAIVGGGAAGVSTLYQIVEYIHKHPSEAFYHIILIEKSEKIGPGLAYSTKSDTHILNLPFSKMSPVPDQPDHFSKWLADEKNLFKWRPFFPNLDLTKADFLPRRLFGIYLEDLALETKEKADNTSNIKVEFIHDEVINILPEDDSTKLKIVLKSKTIVVDKSVLCIGHLPPPHSEYSDLKEKHGYYSSPWELNQTDIPIDQNVIILGTRLSAIDAILERESYIQEQVGKGYQGKIGKIISISRTGLLPKVIGPIDPDYQRRFLTLETIEKITNRGTKEITLEELKGLFKLELEYAYEKINECKISFDLESVLKLKPTDISDWLERDIQQVKENIIRPWQTVLFSLYPFVPNLWESLDSAGKREFLEKYYSYWMIYLAAFPVENAQKILQLLKEDRLEMIGNLKNVLYEEDTFKVLTENSTIYGRYIINATGQAHNITQTNSLILNNLLANEIITPHPLGGIDIKFKNLQIRGKYKHLPLFVIGDSTWGACMATADLYQISQNQIPQVVNSVMEAKKGPISYHTTSRYRMMANSSKNITTEPKTDVSDEKLNEPPITLLNTPRTAYY